MPRQIVSNRFGALLFSFQNNKDFFKSVPMLSKPAHIIGGREQQERLQYHKPLRNIAVRENYDFLIDILHDYQPDFFCAYTEEQSPRELRQAAWYCGNNVKSAKVC